MFRITQNKGFQVTFENGWTVSVQFGKCNYADTNQLTFEGEPEGGIMSPNAEIAAWDSQGAWLRFECDEVDGWRTPDEVCAFMERVRGFSRENHGQDVKHYGKDR